MQSFGIHRSMIDIGQHDIRHEKDPKSPFMFIWMNNFHPIHHYPLSAGGNMNRHNVHYYELFMLAIINYFGFFKRKYASLTGHAFT